MGNPFKSLGKALAKTAPALATAIGGAAGGPIGAAIARAGVKRVAEALDLDDRDPDPAAVEAALKTADMAQLEAVARADRKFEIEYARIAAADRADARRRERDLRDGTPARLAYIDSALMGVAVLGVGFLAWQLAAGETNLNDAVVSLVSAALTGIITQNRSSREYYFGSSAEKNERKR